MDKHQVGKIASAVVAAAGPALAGYAANAVKNRLLNGAKPQSQAKNAQMQASRARSYADVVRNAPVALSQYQPLVGFRTAAPVTKGASARYTGCDFLGTISSGASGVANDNVYLVTPKNSTTFPRLSSVAAAFELYKFLKVRAIAVGKQASTIAGSHTLAPDLYPDGDAFTAAEVRNEEQQQTKKFWETCVMDFPCARGTRTWFLTDNAGTADPPDAKLGELHYYTDATGVTQVVVADLFIEYDVEFAQAQIASGVSLRSDMVQRFLRYAGAEQALLSLVRQMLPEKERDKFDERGMLRQVKKLKEHLLSIDRLIEEGTLPADVCLKPIPAAALQGGGAYVPTGGQGATRSADGRWRVAQDS